MALVLFVGPMSSVGGHDVGAALLVGVLGVVGGVVDDEVIGGTSGVELVLDGVVTVGDGLAEADAVTHTSPRPVGDVVGVCAMAGANNKAHANVNKQTNPWITSLSRMMVSKAQAHVAG